MRSQSSGADDPETRGWDMDALTAERLLDGTSDDPPALADLLARAAGPVQAVELAGEAAALAAFRAAGQALDRHDRRDEPRAGRAGRGGPVPTPGRSRRRWVVAVAAAAFTVGSAGVAVAAATGVLPGGFRSSNGSVERPSSDNLSATATATATATGGPGSGGPAGTLAPPAPAIAGLCRAYLAAVAADKAEELRNPRFDALAGVAGGAEKVPAYCADLLGEPSPRPRPDDHPTGPPTAKPGNRSSVR